MAPPAVERILIEGIDVPAGRRHVDPDAVKVLAASMEKLGLRTPITIRDTDGGITMVLVAGAHRLAAAKQLGWEYIDCIVLDCDETQAELWEIAENLHRAELSVIERAEQIARWVELSVRVSSQVGTKMEKGRPESGSNKAARELGIPRNEIHRAVKISKITAEAKEAAAKAGLSDNQSALLAAAAVSPERQVEAIHNYADAKNRAAESRANVPAPKDWTDVEAEQKRRLMSAWNAASPDVKQWFRDEMDTPVMNARFG